MINRHGLIAGRDRHGQDEDASAHGRPAVKGGRAVLRRRHQGRRDRHGARRRRGQPQARRAHGSRSSCPSSRSAHPVEFLSLSGKRGAQVRATVHSFGPVLLGKVLDLNDTQTAILALIFKYCDDNNLPLLDLKDLAADAEVPVVRRRQGRPGRLRRHVLPHRSASCCARSSSTSRRGRTSSSVSPSSTWLTCSA